MMWRCSVLCLLLNTAAKRVVLDEDATDMEADEFGAEVTNHSFMESSVQAHYDCTHDILIKSEHGQARISGQEYSAAPVYILTKYTKQGRTMSVSCEYLYHIFCSYDRAMLKKTTLCGGVEKKIESRQFRPPIGIRGTSIDTFRGETFIAFGKALHIQSQSAGAVEMKVTSTKCFHSTEDDCEIGCCPQGLICKSHSGSATCRPTPPPRQLLCGDRDPESMCWNVVAKVSKATSQWVLIATSSGGGGHLTAARNLAAMYGHALRHELAEARESLESNRNSMAPESYDKLENLMKHVERRPVALETVDLMESPCTNLLGKAGISMGNMMSGKWNNAQRAGNMEKLRALVGQQWLMQPLFGRQCTSYFKRIFAGKVFPHTGGPTTTISTQPLLLQSIGEAIGGLERTSADGSSMFVNVHMTDLPTPVAVHFFEPMRHIAEHSPKVADRIILHTVAPASGGVPWLEEQTSLKPWQIKIEKFMPVTDDFTRGDGLPRPGTEVALRLKAQLPEEEVFLGGVYGVYKVASEDKVVLIMLGSQPTASAMTDYQAQAKLLEAQAEKGQGLTWVFLATGSPKTASYKTLYEELVVDATQFNDDQVKLGRKMRLIPFTGQPAAPILGRADVSVTRSGGMTCGELLALASRGDNRRTLLHVEVPPGTPESPPAGEEERLQWEGAVLEGGMVPWEAGNARFLMETLGAEVATADILLEVLSKPAPVVQNR